MTTNQVWFRFIVALIAGYAILLAAVVFAAGIPTIALLIAVAALIGFLLLFLLTELKAPPDGQP